MHISTSEIPFRVTSFIILTMFVIVATGCRTYYSFDQAGAQSAAVLDALAANGEMVKADDPDQFRKERFDYIRMVQGRVVEADEIRILAMTRKMTASDARQIEAAMGVLYTHLETLARLPARLKDDGTPADAETEALLKKAGEGIDALDG